MIQKKILMNYCCIINWQSLSIYVKGRTLWFYLALYDHNSTNMNHFSSSLDFLLFISKETEG